MPPSPGSISGDGVDPKLDEEVEQVIQARLGVPASPGLRANLWVAGCTTLANVLAYGFNAVLSRPLGPKQFGEMASLLAIYLVIQVPGVALQAVIARRIAERGDADGVDVRAIIVDATRVGVVLAAILAAISPGLHVFLHIQSWSSLLWLVLMTIPTTICFALIGQLQGQQRFFGVGLLIFAVQFARIVAAVISAKTTPSVSSAFLWSFVLVTAVAVIAALRTQASTTAPREPGQIPALLQVLWRDCASILSIFVLSNIDLLLATHYLSKDEAGGLYAAGNLVTKVAFWAPAFIATVAFPRLSKPAERVEALRRSAAVCATLSAVIVIGAWACAPLVTVVLGKGFDLPRHLAWIFALQGAALATALLGVYASIAVHDRRLTWLAWAVLPVEIVLIATWLHHSSAQIISTVCVGSVILVLAAAFLDRRVLFGRAPQPSVGG